MIARWWLPSFVETCTWLYLQNKATLRQHISIFCYTTITTGLNRLINISLHLDTASVSSCTGLYPTSSCTGLYPTSRFVRNVEIARPVKWLIYFHVATNNITLTYIQRKTAVWQQCCDCWFSAVCRRCDAEEKPTLVELVQKQKKNSIILLLRVLKLVTFHVTGQQIFLFPRIGCPYLLHRLWWKPWLDLLSATVKLQGSIPKAFVCLVWGNGNVWLFRKERGRELWYKEVAKLLQTSDLVCIYSILKSVHQILLCASVRERSPFSFSWEGTFRFTIIPRSIPLSYGIRRRVHWYLCTNIHGVIPKNKEIFIITMVRTSNIGVPDTLSFERHRANEIWFKLNVFVGMLQQDSLARPCDRYRASVLRQQPNRLWYCTFVAEIRHIPKFQRVS